MEIWPLGGNGRVIVLMLTFLAVFMFNSYKPVALPLQLLTSTPLPHVSSSKHIHTLCNTSFTFVRYHALPCYRIPVLLTPSSCAVLYNFIMSLPLALPAQLLSADPNSDHLKQS